MGEKLEYLIKYKGLTITSFARMLDVQPSGISHIISSRNKPSFDLVVKILRLFPEVNPDWLLLDDENVFRSDIDLESQVAHTPLASTGGDVSLFGEQKNSDSLEGKQEDKNVQNAILSTISLSSKSVERVIILYRDKSFESYSPASR